MASQDPRVAYMASTAILDRVLGKVREVTAEDVAGRGERQTPDLSRFNKEQLLTLRTLALTAMRGAVPGGSDRA
jgi:hypothetical protein